MRARNLKLPIVLLAFVIQEPGFTWGAVSSGGPYTLTQSMTGGACASNTSATYSLNAAIGGGFMPFRDSYQPLKGPRRRLYEGFLGVPLFFDNKLTHVVALPGTPTRIVIYAHSLVRPYDPMVEMDPVNTPISVDPSVVAQARQNLAAVYGNFVNTPAAFLEIRILLDDGTLADYGMIPGPRAAVSYSDADNDGVVDGSSPPVAVDSLKAWRLDDGNSAFVKMGGTINRGLRTADFVLWGAGLYAVFGTGSSEVGATYAFPVPWRPNAGNPALYGTPAEGVAFTNLPTLGTISIYTLAGELVHEIRIPPGFMGGQLRWDGRTGSGRDVASGVYIWTVTADGNRKTGKLMVIR